MTRRALHAAYVAFHALTHTFGCAVCGPATLHLTAFPRSTALRDALVYCSDLDAHGLPHIWFVRFPFGCTFACRYHSAPGTPYGCGPRHPLPRSCGLPHTRVPNACRLRFGFFTILRFTSPCVLRSPFQPAFAATGCGKHYDCTHAFTLLRLHYLTAAAGIPGSTVPPFYTPYTAPVALRFNLGLLHHLPPRSGLRGRYVLRGWTGFVARLLVCCVCRGTAFGYATLTILRPISPCALVKPTLRLQLVCVCRGLQHTRIHSPTFTCYLHTACAATPVSARV